MPLEARRIPCEQMLMSWAKWDKTLQPEPRKGPRGQTEAHCGPVTPPLNALWIHTPSFSQMPFWLGEEGERSVIENLSSYPEEVGWTQSCLWLPLNGELVFGDLPSFHHIISLSETMELSERERIVIEKKNAAFFWPLSAITEYTDPSRSRGRAVHNIQGSQSQIINCQCESVDALEVVFCE